MTEQRVSHRYARALLETAALAALEDRVHDDFKLVRETLEMSRELKTMIASPVFQEWKKKKILQEIFSEEKINKVTLDFLLLLIDKGRGVLIPDIIVQYELQYNIMKKQIPVEIASVVELTAPVKTSVITKLESMTKMKMMPEYKVDKALKGGIVIKISDWVFDASIRNQLNILYNRLAEGMEI
jgi:F-type H+-transporting ATPase subunit delta